MSDLILPSAVVALAHKRLREAGTALRNKATATRYDALVGGSGGVPTDAVVVRPTDRRMLALIEQAHTLLSGADQAAMPPGLRIGSGVGRFAVLGTTAYEWPRYAEHFTGDPSWRTEAMRSGSPDPNISLVVVPTTEFALQVGQRARQLTTDADEQLDIAAFTGGMLAAVATDLMVGPVARGRRADLNHQRHDRHGPAAMAAAGRQTVQHLFGGTRGAALWQRWWPTEHEVPDALYDGYLAALSQTYGFTDPPIGFAPFLDGFEPGGDLDRTRLSAGVALLTQDFATSQWGAGEWYLVLSPALLSVPVALLAGRFMSPADGFLTAGTGSTAIGALQMYSLASGIAAISPFALNMYLWANVPEHAEAFVTSLVLGILRFVLTPATVAAAAAGETAATWALWAMQTGTDLYSLIRGIIAAGTGHGADAFIHLINATPSLFGLLTTAFAAIFDALDLTDDLGYWLTWAILTVLIMVPGGLSAAFGLAGAGGVGSLLAPDRPSNMPVLEALQSAAAGEIVAARAALFDDSTLWRDPSVSAATAATLPELRYPTDRQPIVKIWWTGAGTLEIAHDGHTVQLRVDGGAPTVVTLGPDEMTGLAISIRLDEALPDVNTALVDPTLDQRLAYPNGLADPGDDETTDAAHDRRRDEFRPVGTTEEDAYLLRTAPRSDVSTRVGLASGAGRRDQEINVVPAPSLSDLDDSAIGLAGELAAMMMTGAVPSLGGATANTPGLTPIANPVPGPVYQVFRQWNLDERRLNEWRMLVEGGAVSQTANPGAFEPSMRPHPNPAAYASSAPGGEDLLNDMGWISTWRAWLRVATDTAADTAATRAETYTPTVQRRDGRTLRPTNQDLTDAIRFLFDLP